jgi:Kef-type K+ transport system membrane component KefB
MAFSVLLIAGMVGSQTLPGLLGDIYTHISSLMRVLTMVALAFIMIHVGYEFELDRTNLRRYGWDYVIAMTAAALPWIFVCLYCVFVVLPAGAWTIWDAWKESLLVSRFAAPTSTGILFTMLAAAGLSATWLFRKARVLAIFDDLDTVLLMIPLKMLMIGIAWQLGLVVLLMAGMLWLAWRCLHRLRIPVTWPWVLGYAGALVGLSELIYVASKALDKDVPIHLEVLLPAFVLGCMLYRPTGSDPHRDDVREGHQEGPESAREQRVSSVIAALFMVLVGLSMPPVLVEVEAIETVTVATLSAAQPMPGWGVIAVHVFSITVLANLGKMFPAVCYRQEAHWQERLALAIGMWPRGEVGAGILVLALSYGLGGPMMIVAMLSLALNMVLTGVCILVVKKLMIRLPVPVLAPATVQQGQPSIRDRANTSEGSQ